MPERPIPRFATYPFHSLRRVYPKLHIPATFLFLDRLLQLACASALASTRGIRAITHKLCANTLQATSRF